MNGKKFLSDFGSALAGVGVVHSQQHTQGRATAGGTPGSARQRQALAHRIQYPQRLCKELSNKDLQTAVPKL
jgi:hypothetical protein